MSTRKPFKASIKRIAKVVVTGWVAEARRHNWSNMVSNLFRSIMDMGGSILVVLLAIIMAVLSPILIPVLYCYAKIKERQINEDIDFEQQERSNDF